MDDELDRFGTYDFTVVDGECVITEAKAGEGAWVPAPFVKSAANSIVERVLDELLRRVRSTMERRIGSRRANDPRSALGMSILHEIDNVRRHSPEIANRVFKTLHKESQACTAAVLKLRAVATAYKTLQITGQVDPNDEDIRHEESPALYADRIITSVNCYIRTNGAVEILP